MLPIPIIIALIGAGSSILTTILSRQSDGSKVVRIMEAGRTTRLGMVLTFIVVFLIIGGIGTGGFFLVKNLFFNKPTTVSESVVVVETIPEVALETVTPEPNTQIKAGFGTGLVDGLLWPFKAVGNIFNRDIVLYKQDNRGVIYLVGFILGLIITAVVLLFLGLFS